MSTQNSENKGNLLDLIRQSIEIGMPDLRHYYRMTKKARVVASYPVEGQYFVDVQPLRNDETPDAKEPVVPKVAVPVLWGGPERGVVCPPTVGSLCDISYYDGDPNFPFISNIRWDAGQAPPAAELNEFVIQLEPGVEIRIDKEKQVLTLTPSNWIVTVGGNASITAEGNAEITAGGNISASAGGDVIVSADGNAQITAAGNITLSAPQIFQNGNVTTNGEGGGSGTVTETANRTQTGSLTVNGPVNINGPLSVSGGIDGKVNGCKGC